MATQEFEDQYFKEIIYKRVDENDKDELDDIYEMIYKPNKNYKKRKKMEQIEFLKYMSFHLDDEKEYIKDYLRIFGKYFVKVNKNKCKIIINVKLKK